MGAYSELDAALREDGGDFVDDQDFLEDEAFLEDDQPSGPAPDSAGGASAAETASAPDAQAVEAPAAAPAPPADNKADEDAKKQADEDTKRKAHEEAEAKRKAEWEAKQEQKKEAEKLALAKLDAMSDDELLAASLKRVGEDTEKLTRRQMMECVMEHIQTMCLSDPAFARKVMHPRKNMIRCCQYIGRKAWEYVQDELKAKGITPSRENPYGSAIPEGVCYQWAEDYFNDPDAQEDHEGEEKFVPRPYYGRSVKSSKTSKGKGKDKKPDKANAVKSAAPKEVKPVVPKKQDDGGQISFGDFAMPEVKAG